MCYNCGCGNPHDDMGDPENITSETFHKLAKKWGKTDHEAHEKIYHELKENKLDPELKELFSVAAKTWGQSLEDAKKQTSKMLKRQLDK